MSKIKIGKKEYPLAKLADLKDFAGALGASVEEVAAMLPTASVAGFVAAALQPFLPADAPQGHALAVAIQPDLIRIRGEVAKLYEVANG